MQFAPKTRRKEGRKEEVKEGREKQAKNKKKKNLTLQRFPTPSSSPGANTEFT
jgi:hypothetical protein